MINTMTKNYLALIKSLDNDYMIEKLNHDLAPISLKGFCIYFHGKLVKPREGKVFVYPSINAAKEALDRNSTMFMDIKEQLFSQKYGFNWKTNSDAYNNYFFKRDKNVKGAYGEFSYKNDEVWQEH